MTPNLLNEARVYIDRHAFESIKIESIAEMFGVDRTHFSVAFRYAHGINPRRYLMQSRVDYAKQLLRDTDMPPAEIAKHVGFCDQAHFCKTFRQLERKTPLQYRRLTRGSY